MISYREFAVFESAGVAGSGSGDDHGDSSSSGVLHWAMSRILSGMLEDTMETFCQSVR